MFARPNHPLLRGLRFFARADNTVDIRVPEARNGGPGVVTLGTGSRTVLNHGTGALLGDGAATVVTFDSFPNYWSGSKNLTVICRCKATTNSQVAGIVAARENDHSLGWQLLFSNFDPGGVEDGYNFAVFSTGAKFVEAQDQIGSVAQTGKDVVACGVWDDAARQARMYTRQPGDPYALFRSSNTNTNSSNIATEPWDVRTTNPILLFQLNNVSAWFTGAIGWVAIFDRVLNAQEIAAWSRDEEWEFAEDEEPNPFVTGARFITRVGIGTAYAPSGPAFYTTEVTASAFLDGDITVTPHNDGHFLTRVTVGQRFIGDIPQLAFYKNVVRVGEVFTGTAPVKYTNVVRVGQRTKEWVDGRVDLLDATRYRR